MKADVKFNCEGNVNSINEIAMYTNIDMHEHVNWGLDCNNWTESSALRVTIRNENINNKWTDTDGLKHFDSKLTLGNLMATQCTATPDHSSDQTQQTILCDLSDTKVCQCSNLTLMSKINVIVDTSNSVDNINKLNGMYNVNLNFLFIDTDLINVDSSVSLIGLLCLILVWLSSCCLWCFAPEKDDIPLIAKHAVIPSYEQQLYVYTLNL